MTCTARRPWSWTTAPRTVPSERGAGVQQHVRSPCRSHRHVLRYIACGGWHTLLIANDKVIAFGRGEYGRLGVGDDRSRLKPTQVGTLFTVGHVWVALCRC